MSDRKPPTIPINPMLDLLRRYPGVGVDYAQDILRVMRHGEDK